MRVALCTIAKQENKYIKEFVQYYERLGIDMIYLYDNNDKDGERFEDVIDYEIKEGFVTLIDFRGRKRCQIEAYQDCYDKYGANVDWLAYLDVDEFLTFSKETNVKNIKEYLYQSKFDKYNMIHLNWMCYGDNDKLYYEEDSLVDRFPQPQPLMQCVAYDRPENDTIKTIVRGRGNNIKWIRSVHTPQYVRNVCCCDNKGDKIEDAYKDTSDMNFSDAYIRHYSTKTAEEYAIKMKRGFADQNVNADKIRYLIENRFFATNVKTSEKVNVFRKELPFVYEEMAMSFLERMLTRGDMSIFGYNDIQRIRIFKLLRLSYLLMIIIGVGVMLALCLLFIR